MSGRKLLIYLAVLLLVAVGYYLSEMQHSRQEAREKTAKQVFQVKAGDISSLTLKSDKGEIQLQRASGADQATASSPPSAPAPDGGWRLTKPVAAKADDLTINSVLGALTDLKMQRRLDEVSAERLKEFGLEKPMFTLDFQAEGQNHQLRFGHKVLGDQNIYAQKDDEPGVLIIRLSDKETLDRPLTVLRNKKIFALIPDKVTEIRLTRNADRLIIRNAGESGWTEGSHLQTRLRADRIQALLRLLADARALEFVAEKADDLKKYGLAPSPTLRLTLMSGQQEETLLIGSKKGDRYYAQVSGTDPVIEVDKSWVEKLPVSAEPLEDRRLWSGPDNEVQKMVWGGPNQQLSAVRGGSGWEIQQPNHPTPPDGAIKFSLVFWRLKELEFIRLLPASGANQDKSAVFLFQLFGSEDKLLFRLAEISGEKDQTTVIFSQGEKTVAAVIPAKAMAEFKQTLESLSAAAPQGQEKAPAAK